MFFQPGFRDELDGNLKIVIDTVARDSFHTVNFVVCLENRLRIFFQSGFRDELDGNLKRFIDTVARYSFHTVYFVVCLEKRLRMFLQPGFRDEFDDNLKRFIDTVVRDLIINGAPDLGLPVLDPLEVAHLDISLSQDTLV